MELNKKLHFFNPEVALEYGVDEAIMLKYLIYWIATNSMNRTNYIHNRSWTFNSAEKFTKYFPYWSEGQIRRVLQSLLKQGAIIEDNFNKHKYDRTTWYALEDEKFWMENYNPVDEKYKWNNKY